MAQEWLDREQQRRDAGLTHAAYVVLAMLSEFPDRSRRMSDLARRAGSRDGRPERDVRLPHP